MQTQTSTKRTWLVQTLISSKVDVADTVSDYSTKEDEADSL